MKIALSRARPILTSNYDIFIVEDLGMLPKDPLAKIFGLIRQKAKTVHIVYENALLGDPAFYQFGWDAVVYFDERQDFLRNVYRNTYYIPFPCFPSRQGKKEEARKKLNLPPDKKIVLSFCQRGYSVFLPERNHDLEGVIFIILGPENFDVLKDRPKVKEACAGAPDYVEKFSPQNIATKYVELFNSLLKG